MNYEKLFEKIGLPENAKQDFYTLDGLMTKDELLEARKAYADGNEAFEKFVLDLTERKNAVPEKMNLYLTLRLYDEAFEKYLALGTDEEMIYTTAKNIVEVCGDNEEKTGVFGIPIFEIPWFRYHLDAILFKIGRFEYQVAKSEYDTEIDGVRISKGDLCFFVHIPGTKPLDTEVCEDSYQAALRFFKAHYGVDKLVCFCYTWLFQPWLSEILGENTNIMKFQRSYKLLETVESLDHTFRFIFPRQFESLDDYPTDNAIRRTAIARRKNGESIGYGVGVKLITER